jgi:biopolymer transport protein ExbD
MEPQPEIHIRGARTVQYEKVAQIMAAVQRGGLKKIGFPLDPSMQ